MEGPRRHDRQAKRRDRGHQTRSPVKHVLTVSSTLTSVVLSLVGGIVIGGWIAFETPYWQEFRRLVEGIPIGSALLLGLVLFVAATGIGLVTTHMTHSG
jgi:hypothetical protein